MKKSVISFALILAMAVGLIISALAADNSFSDVPADADYAQAVAWCQENGILNGVGGGLFAPEGTLTRAMLVTALYRAAGEPAVGGGPTFTDTEPNVWYSNAVAWANENGIAQGYGNGLFGTDDPVSVEDVGVVMGRYLGTGPEWTGDPAKAHAATRAQVAVALYGTLGHGDRETGKVLVAYFSFTSHTEDVAGKITNATDGDLFEIIPAEPYPSDTSNYYDSDTRAYQEQNDPSARPKIAADCVVEDWDNYDVIFLGYPIWYGAPPKIIYTFLESYDFSGKTVVAFSTSSSSGHSESTLKALASGATWLTGHRFSIGASQSTVDAWIDTLKLSKPKEETAMDKIVLSFNGRTYTATLAENPSAEEFAQLLRSKGGTMTIHMNEYGGWEKVGPLGQTLTRHDIQTTTQAGDFVLYSGSQIVLFYGSNSWNYTRLGKLDDPSGLRDALGDGDVDITFRLAGVDAPSVAVFDLASGTNGNAPTVALNSGYEMPVAGIGTYSLHGDTCKNAVKSALEQGVRLIDTAYMYGNEQEIGEAIREFMAETGTPREDIFLITKIYPGEQFSNPEKAIQDALDKLDIDYIDMMLLHHPGANDVSAYKAMEQAVAKGKIRSLGLSNWYIEEIDDFIAQVSIKPALIQNEIHPYYQEQEVIPYMHDLGIVMQAWYPLGGRGHQKELLSDDTLTEIAQAHGVSVAQVILRWDLQNGVVVIPGSSNPDHIRENISLFGFELTEEEMAAIAALDRGEKHDWY